MKVYIAGMITGDPDYVKKFALAEAMLMRLGHVVLNPADLPEGMLPADYMRICFAMIESADKVFFLENWDNSKGAKLEMAWCQYVEKPFGFLWNR